MTRSGKDFEWADSILFLLSHQRLLGQWGVWLALAGFLLLSWLGNMAAG